jgi:pyruvate dehydrogenase E2 component (dihydrolipoamide acetyltransferase)
MTIEIRIPRLGWSMEEGTFLGWCKKSGEQVSVGEPLFELEGEKAAQEIESLDTGILYIPPDAPQPGSVVPVGGLLGYLLAADDSTPDKSFPKGDVTDEKRLAPISQKSAPSTPPAAGPSVRRLARQLGVTLTDVVGRGPSGRITLEDVRSHAQPVRSAGKRAKISQEVDTPRNSGRRIASPRAKRVAAELGVNWTILRATGRGGRVREADVRAAYEDQILSGSQPRTSTGLLGAQAIPLTSRRRVIAARLRRSRERTVPVTLTTTADVSHLVALRVQFKSAAAAIIPSYTDMTAALVAKLFRRHPAMAVRWDPDREVLFRIADNQFDMGIAVDTPDGLLVPVIRDVAAKSLRQITQESQELIERARAGRLTAAEMQEGAFTITNLGAMGIDAFTPIISYPEIAILGLGAIRREPVVLPDDRIVARERMTLSLTFDHAAVDGAPAATFLRDISQALENPAAHLLAE